MEEQDALSTFDFNKVGGGGGLFTKFRDGVALRVRVLTTDPVISEREFTDKQTGEISLRTQFSFIIYNWTEERAQIMAVTPNIARKIGDIHRDPEFGANIRNVDIRITPTGEKLERRYEIDVMPNPRAMTKEIVDSCRLIDLDKNVTDSKGRMSQYDPGVQPANAAAPVGSSGYEKAKAQAEALKNREPEPPVPDEVITDFNTEEPINLDDIPF